MDMYYAEGRLFEVSTRFKARLILDGDADSGIYVPISGKRVYFTFPQHSHGTLVWLYHHYSDLNTYSDLWSKYKFVLPYPANGRTNSNGEILWDVGYGHKEREFLMYYPNGIHNCPECDYIVNLPDIKHDTEEELRHNSAVFCRASYNNGHAVIYKPAYIAIFLDSPSISAPFEHDYCAAGVSSGWPAWFNTQWGVQAPAAAAAMSMSTMSEEEPTEPNEETIDPNYEIPSSMLMPLDQIWVNYIRDGIYIYYGTSLSKYSQIILHDFSDLNEPNDISGYLTSNMPNVYVKTVTIQDTNTSTYTMVLRCTDSLGICVSKVPLMMHKNNIESKNVRFISDYMYAVTKDSLAKTYYSYYGDKFVCFKADENYEITCNVLSEQEYGDFNLDGTVNLVDFSLIANKMFLNSSNYNYDMFYDYNKDSIIDLKDIYVMLERYLNGD
jgi:hypothetical protein